MVAAKSADEKKNRASQTISVLLLTAMLAGGAMLARRNYRHGRGDREGALRLAALMFVLEIGLWLFRSHFVAGFQTSGI